MNNNSNNGYLLNNRYRLIDQIGEGGMANVYLAQDTVLERKVAIKVLRGDLSHDEIFVKRFQREALAATTLEHPHIVQVFDVGEEQGYHYIVMEYVDGKTLKQLIKQHGPLSVAEVVDVMEQLVAAVEHAHTRHVIHRDIKPQNVMVRSDGEIKLTDFGIALANGASGLTQTNSIMGSVHYLAPELAKGQQASVQSDIYALGILMFELLTGTVPFSGDSAVNIALMHMEEKIPSVREMIPEVNQAVENIILKATSKNKDYRYNSAHEMLLDLYDCENKEDEPKFVADDEDQLEATQTMPIDTIEEDTVTKTSRFTKRTKIMIGILGGLVAIALGLLFFLRNDNNLTDIHMPNVVTMTQAQAVEALTEKQIVAGTPNNFTIEIVQEYSAEVPEGQVIKTNPEAETQLERESTITLYISSGHEPVAIPDVTGMTSEAATSRLQDAGFRVRVEQEDSDQTQNIVFRQSPAGGGDNRALPDSEITIYIPTELVTVPNVVGRSTTAATQELERLGFVVNVEERPSSQPSGQVINQTPGSGTQQRKGATITIEVAVEELIPVPTVTGLTYGSALSTLQGMGFIVNNTNCVENYIVASQDPATGTRVVRGTRITLTCTVTQGGNGNNE